MHNFKPQLFFYKLTPQEMGERDYFHEVIILKKSVLSMILPKASEFFPQA
jgi:hypothetical protein